MFNPLRRCLRRKSWMILIKILGILCITLCFGFFLILSPPSTSVVYLAPFEGLGNQLFQYACSYSIARNLRVPLYIRIPRNASSLHEEFTWSSESLHKQFGLHHFHIPLESHSFYYDIFASQEFMPHVKFLSDQDVLHQTYQNKSPSIYRLTEYCQSFKVFALYEQDIRSFFRVKNTSHPTLIQWEKVIQDTSPAPLAPFLNLSSVCIHVRRGDFVPLPRRVVNMSFYAQAIEEMNVKLKEISRHPQFFVFSDDIPFVKKYIHSAFRYSSSFHWTAHNTSIRIGNTWNSVFWVSESTSGRLMDLHLMTKCHHHIIMGSSFAWWGAFLNENPEKIVIAADYHSSYFRSPQRRMFHKTQYYPPGWIVKRSAVLDD